WSRYANAVRPRPASRPVAGETDRGGRHGHAGSIRGIRSLATLGELQPRKAIGRFAFLVTDQKGEGAFLSPLCKRLLKHRVHHFKGGGVELIVAESRQIRVIGSDLVVDHRQPPLDFGLVPGIDRAKQQSCRGAVHVLVKALRMGRTSAKTGDDRDQCDEVAGYHVVLLSHFRCQTPPPWFAVMAGTLWRSCPSRTLMPARPEVCR